MLSEPLVLSFRRRRLGGDDEILPQTAHVIPKARRIGIVDGRVAIS